MFKKIRDAFKERADRKFAERLAEYERLTPAERLKRDDDRSALKVGAVYAAAMAGLFILSVVDPFGWNNGNSENSHADGGPGAEGVTEADCAENQVQICVPRSALKHEIPNLDLK